MALPKIIALHLPILKVLSDEKEHELKEVRERIADLLELSGEELTLRVASGQQTQYASLIGWARTNLLNAKAIENPRRGYLKITERGKQLCERNIEITYAILIETSPKFAEHERARAAKKGAKTSPPDSSFNSETDTPPQETMERMYQLLNDQLAEELLSEIFDQTPYFFEKLVLDLMEAMGYGSGLKTQDSHDGGIDGIIHEDKLGFNLIYVQAKRWAAERTIERSDIQQFLGAMAGPPKVEKGLFITTAKFSKGAREFAESQHIILVDGKQLTKLMIEHGVGVSVQKTYNLKRIDSDYFADN